MNYKKIKKNITFLLPSFNTIYMGKDSEHVEIGTEKLEETKGKYFGKTCYIPPSDMSDIFCKGFEKSIELGTKIGRLDKSKFQFYCNTTKFDIDTEINKSKLENPTVDIVFPDSLITITRIDPLSEQTQEMGLFTIKRKNGEIKNNICIIPKNIVSEKFCEGFDHGNNIIFQLSLLDKKKFKSNCKQEKIDEQDNIIYGYDEVN